MRVRWFSVRFVRLLIVVGLLGSLVAGSLNVQQTAAAPAPAPILLVVNDAAPNPYGRYLAEILRAEGLNAFDTRALSTLTAADLSAHAVTILAETPLSSAQVALLSSAVSGGARLLALRPDPQIAALFGLGASSAAQTNGYLTLNSAAPLAQGLPTTPLQIHGSADHYAVASASTIATLAQADRTPTTFPAVVTASYGSGQTAAFTYDLATNVIMTRQGNPANADVDTDNDGVLRTIDLFQNGSTPWVDRDLIPVPQADVQQRLFARLVTQLASASTPLPQLWYFPGSAKSIIIPTGDAHGQSSAIIQNELTSLKAHGGTMTVYLSLASDPDDAQMQTWRAQGHTFGIHPYTYKPDGYMPYDIQNLAQGYDVYAGSDGSGGWFGGRFSSPKSRTVRNHQVAWKGWTVAAEYAAAHGIALDTSFYHWGAWLKQADGTWPHGYITGSGQPMKFIKADGTVLPVYQQLTELVDEQLFASISVGTCAAPPPTEGFECLNATQALAVSRQLIDASLAGDYAALTTQFHVDYYNFGDPQSWAEQTLDYATSKGVPIWNADEWLTFTEMRHDATFENVAWSATSGQLTFDLSAASTGQTLSVLLPLAYTSRALLGVTSDGGATSFSAFTIAGKPMALVSVPAGKHSLSAQYAPLSATATPLTPTPLTPTPLTATPLTATPLTATPLTPTPLTPSPLTPSPLTPSPLTPSPPGSVLRVRIMLPLVYGSR